LIRVIRYPRLRGCEPVYPFNPRLRGCDPVYPFNPRPVAVIRVPWP